MTDADASSPGAVVDSLYRLLSGPANVARDWAAVRKLCAPEMRASPVELTIGGGLAVELFDIESYVLSRAPMFAASDFYESDVGRRIDESGDIAHVWSAYAVRHAPDGPPVTHGVTSFQLIRRAGRWSIISAVWQLRP